MVSAVILSWFEKDESVIFSFLFKASNNKATSENKKNHPVALC